MCVYVMLKAVLYSCCSIYKVFAVLHQCICDTVIMSVNVMSSMERKVRISIRNTPTIYTLY